MSYELSCHGRRLTGSANILYSLQTSNAAPGSFDRQTRRYRTLSA